VPQVERSAGRRLWRRDLLRPLHARRAAAAHSHGLRRHRLQMQRRRRFVAHARRCGGATKPLPRTVRSGAGGADGEIGPGARRRPARTRIDRCHHGTAPRWEVAGQCRRTGDRRDSEASATRWGGRPRKPRQLPRCGRLHRAAEGHRDGTGGGDPRGHRGEAAGPGWRRLPGRAQVGFRRPRAGASALPGVQRRRVRARHVQRPGADGERSVRRGRGDGDSCLRDRL